MNKLLNSLRRSAWIQALVLAAMTPGLVFLPAVTRANPSGGSVAHGNVEIGEMLNGRLDINQLSNKAIINWDDFSIAAGELTKINQPGAGAAILNRVISGNPSALNGALQANGKVFVINPNGIVVGPTGSIDVGGLVLSTLDVSDANFLAGGDMIFRGNSANGVKNFGRINAIGGDVFLVGQQVQNAGTITSNGTVGLAGGNEVLITANPDANGERVFVRPSGRGSQVANSGTIEGASVELKAHGNAFALAINNSGSIRATGATRANGGVFLRAPGGRVDNTGSIRATLPNSNGGRILIEGAIVNAGGTIDASGVGNGKGGAVTLLGDEINVPNGAKVKADGSEGGTVTIGDENTNTVNVAAGSSVSANGSSGAGGTITITGGLQSTLTVGGNVSASGANGEGGQILVNGTDIAVQDTANLNADGFEGGSIKIDATNSNVIGGSINATGAKGGRVTITGDLVELATTAAIDVSGTDIGGIARIGGGFQGNQPGIRNSSSTLVRSGSVIKANSTGARSPGGTVIIWSDGLTDFKGDVSAEGVGQGGFVEVSGKDTLIYDGLVSTLSSQGKNGTLLLDPVNVTIGNTTSGNQIDDNAIEAALGSGNVVITTNAPGTEDGWIKINEDISYSSINSLTFLAHGDIYVRREIINNLAALGGNINLVAGWDGSTGLITGTPDNPPFLAPLTTGGDVDMQTDVFDNWSVFGKNGAGAGANGFNFGSVFLGLDDSGNVGNGFRVGSRSGETNVAGYDVQVIGGNLDGGAGATANSRFAQLGWFSGTSTASGDIRVQAHNDVNVEGGSRLAPQNTTGGNNDRAAYGRIGHGGTWSSVGTGDISGDIEIEARGDVLVKGGNNDYSGAAIGHGGAGADRSPANRRPGDVSGDITVLADGNITLTGGLGPRINTKIGHGGYVWRPLSSGVNGTANILVRSGGDVSVTGGINSSGGDGGRDNATQIGHGGLSSRVDGTNQGWRGDITVEAGVVGAVTAGVGGANGAVTVQAGDKRDNFAMIGHGGRDSHAGPGNAGVAGFSGHAGAITVNAIDGVSVIAGTRTAGVPNNNDDGRLHAQIGHGGYNGDIRGTRGPLHGHRGDIVVTTTGGDINVLGGDVNRADNPSFGGGQGRFHFGQIGHGGYASDGDHRGNVTVRAGVAADGTTVTDLTSKINVLAGSTDDNSRENYNFGQIGHGGAFARGDHGRDGEAISVLAASDITVQGGRFRPGDTNDNRRSYAQIGSGGFDADNPNPGGNAGSVSGYLFDGYGAVPADSYGQARFGPTAAQRIGNTGDITVGTINGSILVESGQTHDSEARVGHGGQQTDGDHTGDITVFADVDRSHVLTGGGNISFLVEQESDFDRRNVQLGHGGYFTGGGFKGDIEVTNGGDTTFQGGGNNSYAQLGHGARGADPHTWTSRQEQYQIDVTPTTNDGDGVPFTTGTVNDRDQDAWRTTADYLAFSSRHVGGNSGNNTVALVSNGGVAGAGMIVSNGNALNDLSIFRVGDVLTYSAETPANTIFTQTFTVTSVSASALGVSEAIAADLDINDSVLFVNDGTGTTPLGGGTSADAVPNDVRTNAYDRYYPGTHTGDISLKSTGNILFRGYSDTGTGNDNGLGYVQLGHGGFRNAADPISPNNDASLGLLGAGHNGDITVHAGGLTVVGGKITAAPVNAAASITFQAGAQNDSYALLGHGGTEAWGNHSGDIEVAAAGGINVFAGDNGNTTGGNRRAERSYAMIGHGGRRANYEPWLPRSLESTFIGGAGGTNYNNAGAPGSYFSEDVLNNPTYATAAGWNGAGFDALVPFDINNPDANITSGIGQGSLWPLTTIAGLTTGMIDPAQIRFVDHDGDPLTPLSPIVPTNRTTWYHIAAPAAPIDAMGNPVLGNSGDVTVVNYDGDITLRGATGASRRGRDAFVQVGHGGMYTAGAHNGDISVRNQGGDIAMTGGMATDNGWNYNAYVQVGHGGRESGGAMSGDISVVATGSVTAQAGRDDVNYVQVGHGGYDANFLWGRSNDATNRDGDSRVGVSATDRRGDDVYKLYMPLYRVRDDLHENVLVDAGVDNLRVSNPLNFSFFDGNIDVVGGTGVSFLGTTFNGIAPSAYAQVGHGGRSTQSHSSGNITVDASGNDPTMGNMNIGAGGAVYFAGGNSGQSFAQLGHGGYDGDGNHGTRDIDTTAGIDGDITVRAVQATAGGNAGMGVFFSGGTQDDAFVQLGHGGSSARSASWEDLLSVSGADIVLGPDGIGDAAGHRGTITVESEGTIAFVAGSDRRTTSNVEGRVYALLGHGGYDADAHSDVISNGSSSVAITSTPDFNDALGGTIGNRADIFVSSTEGAIKFYAGDSSRADLPSRGASVGRFNFSQLGHGGYAARGGNAGNIKVNAGFDLMGTGTNVGDFGAASSDILFLASNKQSGRVVNEGINYVQLGHGGRSAYGNQGDRDASGNATEVISVMSGRDITFKGGVAGENYAQLGNGGRDARGDHAANIQVFAERDILFQAPQADNLAGIGPFGSNLIQEGGLDNAGDASLATYNMRNQRVVPESVLLTIIDTATASLGGEFTFKDLRDSATSTTGMLFQTVGGLPTGPAVATVNYVTGQITFTTQITSNNGGNDLRVEYEHADSDLAYVQLGNGGYDADQPNNNTTLGSTGDIRVTARTGHFVLQAGKDNRATAQVGHGGWQNRGTNSGDISIRAAGDVNVFGGTGGYRDDDKYIYAQIGHGGWDSDGAHSGAIKISSGSGVLTTSVGDLLGDYNDLGDFNMDSIPDVINFGADVSGTGASIGGQAGVGVLLKGGDFADLAVAGPHNDDDNSAHIGHGGRSAAGNKDGVIAVSASEGISLLSGNGYRAWTQIGHGGLAGTGTLSGDISVIADGDRNGTGDLVVDAATRVGSEGFEGYALVGHGDDRDGGPGGGTRSGSVFAQGATITVLPDGNNLAQIGHNSSAANEGIDQSGANPSNFSFIQTDAAADFTVDAAFAAQASLYAGSGGGITIATGRDLTHSGDIIGSSAEDYNLLAGRHLTINNAFINSGAGVANLVAGWDLTTGINTLDFNDCPPGQDFFSIAPVKADVGSWGLNGGILNVGTGSQTSAALAGAAGGTNALGYEINVTGSDGTTGAAAQIGFNSVAGGNADATGDVMAFSKDGGIDIEGGEANGAFAQIGNGGSDANAEQSGAVMIDATFGTAPAAITVTGGGGDNSYAQAGNGGAGADGTKNGTTSVSGSDVSVIAGDGTRAAAQIGAGGSFDGAAGAGGAITTATTVNATGNVVVNAAAGGQNSSAQIGAGGLVGGAGSSITGLPTLGNISVNVTAGGTVDLTGGTTNVNTYAQIGDGGAGFDGAKTNSGVAVSGTAITLNGGDASGGYAQIGSGGGVTNGGNPANGDVTGDVTVVATAGGINAAAGNGRGAYVQIGNGGGGFDGTIAATGLLDGDVNISATDDITLAAGDGQYAYGQFGHGGNDRDGIKTGDVFVVSSGGGVSFQGGAGSEAAYAQAGHGGADGTGDASGDITIEANGVGGENVDILGGDGLAAYAQVGHGNADANSFDVDGDRDGTIKVGSASGEINVMAGAGAFASSQVGHGGVNDAGNVNGLIFVTADEAGVTLEGSATSNAHAQVGHGGAGARGTKDGDIFVEGTSVTLNSGGANSYTQIGSGGLGSIVDASSDVTVTTTTGAIALNAGASENAYSLIGSGGGGASGNFVGDIIVNSATTLDVIGGGTLGDGIMGGGNFAQIGHAVDAAVTPVEGILLIDALDFNTRTGTFGGNSWRVIPSEGGVLPGTVNFVNALGGDYVQLLQGAGAGGPAGGAEITFLLNITTPGTYRLFPRWTGYDGGSDSIYFNIVELSDGPGGSIADHYEFAGGGNSDFNNPGWFNQGGFETTNAGATPQTNAVWTIGTAGVYTMRVSPREDGAALDAFVLQLASLPAPTGSGPSFTTTSGGVGTASGNVLAIAAGDINVNGGTGADSYGAVGHGGTGLSSGANFEGNVSLASLGGSVNLAGGQFDAAEGPESGHAAVGHHGKDGSFSAAGDVSVVAEGNITGTAGTGEDSFVRVGSGGTQLLGNIDGSTTVNSGGAVAFTAGDGFGAYAQVGPGGLRVNGVKGDGVGDAVTIDGTSVTFLGGGGDGAFAHAGAGGASAGGAKAGDVNITATSGSIIFMGGDGQTAYVQAGNGGAQGGGVITGNVTLDAAQDIAFQGGDGLAAYAMGGLGGLFAGGAAGDSGTTISAKAGNDFILEAGSGDLAYGQFGLGGANANGAHSGETRIEAGNDVRIESGDGNLTYAQVGGGGANASGLQNVDTFIEAMRDVEITRGAGQNAYVKVGNGDQLFDFGPGDGGAGERSGDVHVTAGRTITSNGGMFGHVDPSLTGSSGLGGTLGTGSTILAASRDNVISTRLTPVPTGNGSIIGDSDSVFTAAEELRFYAPTRSNIQLTGASLNGTPFIGMPAEGSVQRADEFTVVALEDGGPTAVLNEHANLADTVSGQERWENNFDTGTETTDTPNYNPLVPASFYLDSIVVPDSATAGNPGGGLPTGGGDDGGDDGGAGGGGGNNGGGNNGGGGGGGNGGVGGGLGEEIEQPIPPGFDAVFDSDGNLVPFDNNTGLDPVGSTLGPNGEPVEIFGTFVDDQGLFLERNGVVGITPNRLEFGSPFLPVGPIIGALTDDYFKDDLLYDFETGERVIGLGRDFVIDYAPSTLPGMSSFDVWGESTFRFDDLIVTPQKPPTINPPEPQTPAEIELEEAEEGEAP